MDPGLLAVARGDAEADLVLAGARAVDVFTRRVLPASVAVWRGRIAGVGAPGVYARGRRVIDLRGAFLAPGLIDAHMHCESTMLPPGEFAALAVPHGTTAAVLDPHEIANVLGVPGIRWMMEAGRGLPLRCLWALSSCVPSCHLETAGARIEAADLAPLFDEPDVVGLAEMMNFPGAVAGDPAVLAKVNLGLSRGVVDGHAPGLGGPALCAYAAAGITSDHECTTGEEALEKLRLGLHVHIREGSAARNLGALLPLVTPATAHLFSFCTDDRHPADLHDEGHIDHVVRRAIALGLDMPTAWAIGSLHTARHYGLPDAGAVAPGHRADLVVFDDDRAPRARLVFSAGEIAAEDGRAVAASGRPRPPLPPGGGVRLPADLSPAALRVPHRGGAAIRVIGMDPHQLVTEDLRLPPRVEGGAIVADTGRDVLKLAVIERHRGSERIGVGFVRGFGLQRGAIASTVGHDAHNLAVLGADDADMIAAARALEACGGGQCAVENGRVLATLPLPIAGLMSDRPAAEVITQQAALLAATRALGCPLHDPFMPLSFMPLPVIPRLKLSDLGLVDVVKFEIVPLEA
ncbi:MAG: adenine deaminase [Phycisphaerales bacterium]|nr:adenine deaminase [Phycisphaerales bacterium]